MSIQLNGLDALVKKINRLGGKADDALLKGIQKSVQLVRGDARDLCPAPTGTLRSSIELKVETNQEEIKGSVGTNKEYAIYVELGTGQRGEASPSPPKAPIGNGYKVDWSGMPAQPFLYPALMQNKEAIKELCIEELNKEIQKLGGH